jgi:hypothetical protein
MDEGQIQAMVYELDKQVAVLQQRANSADKAVIVALTDLGRRLDEMNQFRAQINTERNTFMTKEIFDAKHDELDRKLAAGLGMVTEKIGEMNSWKSNMQGRMWMLGAVLATLMGLLKWVIK